MNKINTPEQILAANKANIETMMNLANSVFARVERLAALNLNTARAMMEDTVATTKTLMAMKNPQDVVGLQSSLAQPMIDRSMSYGRSVYEIMSEGQQEMSKLVEAQIAELNKNFSAALDQAAKTAPAGSETVFAAIKSVVAASNSAYENVSKAAKQMAETAEGNMTAATEATVKAVTGKKAA